MEFKIDTKASYTQISPVSAQLNANMAAALTQKCTELTNSDSQNFLIDLSNCQSAEADAFDELVALHDQCYADGQSLVFTNISAQVMNEFKEAGADEVLNIVPTEIEAIDIISMEILERDLFNEAD